MVAIRPTIHDAIRPTIYSPVASKWGDPDVSNFNLMNRSIGNGDGLALDFLSDTALVVDSGTPANAFFDRNGSLLTITSSAKYITGGDGNLTATSANTLALDHDVSTLTTSSTANSIGTGRKTWTLAADIEFRNATTAWADATSYSIGDQRQVNNRSYTCILAHTSSGSNRPSGEGNAQWKRDEKYVRISDQSDVDGNYVIGRVDTYDGTSELVVDVLRAVGSGSASSWHVIECKGCLIEEARTNLWVYSEALNNATGGYTEINASPVLAYATGPDGLSSATRLIDDSGTGTGNVFIQKTSQAVSTATAYTFSVFAKADQLSWLALGVANFTTPANGHTFFNLSNGTVGTVAAGTSGAVEDAGNGWYRCSIAFTTDAADTFGNLQILVSDGDADITVDRDGTSSILIYGAQFEAGSFPTSYIATSGSTVARAADVISLATSDYPHSATEGTLYVEAIPRVASDLAGILSVNDGSGNEEIVLYKDASANLVYQVEDGGANQLAPLDSAVNASDDTQFRIAASYKANDFAISADGAAAATDTGGTLPTVTTLELGVDQANNYFNGWLRNAVYVDVAETDAQHRARAA